MSNRQRELVSTAMIYGMPCIAAFNTVAVAAITGWSYVWLLACNTSLAAICAAVGVILHPDSSAPTGGRLAEVVGYAFVNAVRGAIICLIASGAGMVVVEAIRQSL